MSDWYEPWANVRWDPTLTPLYRREVIRQYGQKFPNRTFVETGTSDGGTVENLAKDFNQLHTVEIAPSIFNRSKDRLKDYTNIKFWLGDSTVVLPEILAETEGNLLFWLDGHFCGDPEGRGVKDTPIIDELRLILADKRPHVILIDDARLFGNDPVYPEISWVRNLATTQDIRYAFSYQDDIMRIVPV